MSEDGKVTIETGLDMSGIKKDIEGLEQVFKSSGMNASLSTLKEAVKGVDTSAEKLDKTIQHTAKSLKSDLKTAAGDSSKGLDHVEKEAKEAGREVESLGRKGKEAADLLKKGFAVLGGAKLLGWMKSGASAIGQAAESYNSALRGAATLFGDVDVNFENLSENMLRLSGKLNMNADELATALYGALSAGIPVTEDMGEALSFLESSAKTAKGGFTDVNTVVTATASIMNAYGLTVADVDRIQGILMQTQNKGITTVGELGDALAQVIPTAASFKVPVEEVGAALATMTASGTKTAQATTSLNSMMAELGKDGQVAAKNLKAAAEAAGLGEKNFQAMIDEGYSIADILLVMQNYAESNGQTLLDMFGSVEAGRAALQLASGDAEKFNTNLESMKDTSGLVKDAFETMTTGLDAFRTSWDNAKKKIGTEYLPSIDNLAGSASVLLDKIVGNTSAADDLQTSLDNVVTATEAYKTAQEHAKTATDETTQSMLDQSAAAYRVAVNKMVSTYEEAAEDAQGYRDELENLQRQSANAERGLNTLAKNVGVTREELTRMAAAGELTNIQFDAFKMYSGNFQDINASIDQTTLNLENAETAMANFRISLGTAAKKGLVDLDSLKITNYELYESVVSVAEAMTRGEEMEASFVEAHADEEDVLKAKIDTLTAMRNLVSKNSEEYVILTSRLNTVTAAYEKLGLAAGKATGGSGTSGNASGSSGSSGGKSGGKSDNVSLPGMSFNIGAAKTAKETVQDIYDSTIASLMAVTREEMLFGESAETSAKRTNILKDAMIQISAYGGDAEEALAFFAAMLDQISDKQPEVKSFLKEMCDYFKDLDGFASDAATTFGNTLTAGFKALGKEVGASFQKIKDLEEDIADANEDLADKQDDLLDAQEELNDARARGNEGDIEAAEKKVEAIEAEIDGIQAVIKAKGDEKKSVENGETAWKAFGRTALSALAQVLYGVGAQLAAEAVLRAIALDWAGAGIATAGSAAAIAAGVGLDAAAGAFEKGGIVPQKAGVPSTGDRHVARVNPGELILNEAQQSNLADQIRAARMNLDEAASASAGRSIVVNLAGSHIYGLDEPAVGRAIYENIRTLESEGVL